MPTFNQLVRKGRETSIYKSTSPALQKGRNTLKDRETDRSAFPPEERRLHRSSYRNPQEAQLRTA